jgi:hypothetical protein
MADRRSASAAAQTDRIAHGISTGLAAILLAPVTASATGYLAFRFKQIIGYHHRIRRNTAGPLDKEGGRLP